MTTLTKGYTLIELVVSIGLFALVMTLATGAYLVMIGVNRQTQGLATGINNLSFALETMTTAMRTGTNYCAAGDCHDGSPSQTFSFKDQSGHYVRYGLVGNIVETCQTQSTVDPNCTLNTPLTSPTEVHINSLTFTAQGTKAGPPDTLNAQPHVTILISGTVTVGPGKTQAFTVESSAAMRGSDI